MKRYLPFILLLFLRPAQSQTLIPADPWQVDSAMVARSKATFWVFPAHHYLKPQTLDIKKNGIPLTITDFSLVNEQRIEFYVPLQPGDTLHIRYKRQPFNLPRRLALFDTSRSSIPAGDSLSKILSVQPARQLHNPFAEMPPGLNTSGSLMRGVRIGSNQDLTLNSGLNLEIAGQLTEQVEIVAALTDEATPIQPEGNTQSLNEVDKVFVHFKSPYLSGTVGDFNLFYDDTRFARLSRKLQGLTLSGDYRKQQAGVTAGTTRGYFNHILLIGQEGRQGPYQLTGENGRTDIVVLAGTERIWIDGQEMQRGESNDYIIEYGNGQITFTNNRLITSASRLEADFEYFPSDQQFNRNVYSAITRNQIGPSWKIGARYFLEKDDPGQLFESGTNLSAEDKEIIRAAGDDPLSAVRSGVTAVSDSAGSYSAIDTVIAGQALRIYRYRGAGQGDYQVRFSYVGNGLGDYVRDRLGVYRFAGPGAGSYLPLVLLPLPSSLELTDIDLEWTAASGLTVRAETALSRQDRNVLSALNDGDNIGLAWSIEAAQAEREIGLAGLALGSLSWQVEGRQIDEHFTSASRLNRADYNSFWNILNSQAQSSQEQSLQGNLQYLPRKNLRLKANIGQLKKSTLNSSRQGLSLYLENRNGWSGRALTERIESRITTLSSRNLWQRYQAGVGHPLGWFSPELRYQREDRRNVSRQISGFVYDEYGLRLGLLNRRHVDGFLDYGQRQDYLYDVAANGKLVGQAWSQTAETRLELKNLELTSGNLRLVFRKKDYTRRFEAVQVDSLKALYSDVTLQDTTWQDRSTNLAEVNLNRRNTSRSLSLGWQYRISTEQTALKEKIYLEVGQGRGLYRYDEQLSEYVPDPDGNFVLFILPSGQFKPVTKLETSWRLLFDFSKQAAGKTNAAGKWLSLLSGETYLRFDEETGEKKLASIYLLNLNKFQGDQTIRGSIIYNQDIFINRQNRALSWRLRYRYRDDLFNQYLDAGENEDRLNIERSVQADWRISSEIQTQNEISNKNLRRISAAAVSRNRNISGWYGKQRTSWRPIKRWEFGLENTAGLESNAVSTYPLDLWYLLARLRLNYAWPAKGRFSAEYNLQKVSITKNPLNLVVPFEMAQGKRAGLSKTWQLHSEYTVAKNIVFSLQYSGRDEAGFEKIIHSGQAELRAFF